MYKMQLTLVPCPARDLFLWLNIKVKVHTSVMYGRDEDNRKEILCYTWILGIPCYHYVK